MTDILPLLADASRVGLVLSAMALAYWVTSRAYKDATDRYRLTAEEATTEMREFRTKFDECVKRLADVETQLGLSQIREYRLAVRIENLELLIEGNRK